MSSRTYKRTMIKVPKVVTPAVPTVTVPAPPTPVTPGIDPTPVTPASLVDATGTGLGSVPQRGYPAAARPNAMTALAQKYGSGGTTSSSAKGTPARTPAEAAYWKAVEAKAPAAAVADQTGTGLGSDSKFGIYTGSKTMPYAEKPGSAAYNDLVARGVDPLAVEKAWAKKNEVTQSMLDAKNKRAAFAYSGSAADMNENLARDKRAAFAYSGSAKDQNAYEASLKKPVAAAARVTAVTKPKVTSSRTTSSRTTSSRTTSTVAKPPVAAKPVSKPGPPVLPPGRPVKPAAIPTSYKGFGFTPKTATTPAVKTAVVTPPKKPSLINRRPPAPKLGWWD